MRLLILGATFVVGAALATPYAAAATDKRECDAQFVQDSATIILLATDLGHDQAAVGQQDVQIASGTDPKDTSACRLNLRVSRLSNAETFPDYSLTASGAAIRPSLSEALGGASETAITVPASRAGRTVTFRASAITDWGILAGQFVEQLQLSLVDDRGEIIDRMALNLVLEIPKTVDVMFVGATGSGETTTIDLGVLSPTDQTLSPPFGVRIWSSSAYSFGFRSEHRGLLQHEQNMDAIPYRLNVNGRTVPLEGSPQTINNFQPSVRGGDFYPLGLSVPARRSVAGRYNDRLTVSVTAL